MQAPVWDRAHVDISKQLPIPLLQTGSLTFLAVDGRLVGSRASHLPIEPLGLETFMLCT